MLLVKINAGPSEAATGLTLQLGAGQLQSWGHSWASAAKPWVLTVLDFGVPPFPRYMIFHCRVLMVRSVHPFVQRIPHMCEACMAAMLNQYSSGISSLWLPSQ